MQKTHVLIVDDETSIRKYLRANLELNGYKVSEAVNGQEGISAFEGALPDLLVLDINMPGLNGFEVCKRVREWSKVPIIMLSARGDESDKVRCLDLGADDYITKPFGKDEFIARVKAVLRRNEGTIALPASSFSSGDLEINFAKRHLRVDGRDITLTPTEYSLLQELVLNSDKVLSYTHLLNKIWGPEYLDEKEYLHVFVRRLRVKIEDDSANPKYIGTVPGIGYQFISEE